EAGATGTEDQKIEVELIHESRSNVDVALLLQLHHADDAALRERPGPRGQLLERDVERLHRIAAGPEADALALELVERALDVRVHVLRDEVAERGAVDHELDGLDVLHATDALDVVLDVAEDEARLVDARLVEVIDDLVLLRLLAQMSGLDGSDGSQDRSDQRDDHRVLLWSGFASILDDADAGARLEPDVPDAAQMGSHDVPGRWPAGLGEARPTRRLVPVRRIEPATTNADVGDAPAQWLRGIDRVRETTHPHHVAALPVVRIGVEEIVGDVLQHAVHVGARHLACPCVGVRDRSGAVDVLERDPLSRQDRDSPPEPG